MSILPQVVLNTREMIPNDGIIFLLEHFKMSNGCNKTHGNENKLWNLFVVCLSKHINHGEEVFLAGEHGSTCE